MPSLVVGGVTIPVAVSSPSWSRSDAADVGRVFDHTLFISQAGGAAREWDFETPPVTTALADSYIAVLGSRAAKLCSGDILQLPTMCSPELPSGTPIRKSVGHNVVLRFRLHEVQSAKALFKYAPGDTLTGETFTRSTTAYYFTTSGLWALAGVNVKRDNHWAAGAGGRSTLLEGAGLNGLLWSQDFSNAAWTKSSMTVAGSIADPAGGTTANRLTATGAGAQAFQNLGASSSFVRTNSLWVRRVTGSGNVRLIAPDSSFSAPLGLPAGVWSALPFSVTGAASTGRIHGIELATSGDVVEVWGAQLEDGSFPTSYIPTTTAAVARGADSYSLPFTVPPQEMTVYLKFYELGTIKANVVLMVISNAAEATPYFRLLPTTNQYQAAHNNGVYVSSTLADAPVLQDAMELNAHLYGDGSVDITQSRNGAAATAGAQSAANALAAAWSGQLVWLNSEGSVAPGFIAVQSFKIVAGARSLAEMRTL